MSARPPASVPLLADAPLRVGATLASILLAPVLAWQGRRVRRTALRLPEAGGPTEGDVPGDGPPLHLLVVGESTVAGVGVDTLAEALPGRAAAALAAATGRPVRWRALGRNGITARDARIRLVESAATLRADVAMVAVGVNDVLALRSAAAWTRELEALAAAIRARCGDVPIVVAQVAPVGRFPTLPQPLRWTLGLRARVLDRAAARWAAGQWRAAYATLAVDAAEAAAFFCRDGFHPSALGYARWGDAMARAAVALLPRGAGGMAG